LREQTDSPRQNRSTMMQLFPAQVTRPTTQADGATRDQSWLCSTRPFDRPRDASAKMVARPRVYYQMLTQKRTVDRKRIEIANQIATLAGPTQVD
jgi:hypothetical protein